MGSAVTALLAKPRGIPTRSSGFVTYRLRKPAARAAAPQPSRAAAAILLRVRRRGPGLPFRPSRASPAQAQSGRQPARLRGERTLPVVGGAAADEPGRLAPGCLLPLPTSLPKPGWTGSGGAGKKSLSKSRFSYSLGPALALTGPAVGMAFPTLPHCHLWDPACPQAQLSDCLKRLPGASSPQHLCCCTARIFSSFTCPVSLPLMMFLGLRWHHNCQFSLLLFWLLLPLPPCRVSSAHFSNVGAFGGLHSRPSSLPILLGLTHFIWGSLY